MADMPRGGIERVLRPPAYEGREPEHAYAYGFTDYLGILSVEVGAVGPFVEAITSGGGESDAATLPIQIEAIGAFNGQTEIDCEDRDDFFEEPRPYGAYFLEQNPPSYVKLPFAEKPGVVHPDNELLEALYRVDITEGRSEIGLTTRQDRVPHYNLRLQGGVIDVKGTLHIPSSPALTAAVAAGYTSPSVEINLHAPIAAGESKGEEASDGDRFTSSSPLLIERVYDPEPRWLLERPYNRFQTY